jgi:hypothetical protein
MCSQDSGGLLVGMEIGVKAMPQTPRTIVAMIFASAYESSEVIR